MTIVYSLTPEASIGSHPPGHRSQQEPHPDATAVHALALESHLWARRVRMDSASVQACLVCKEVCHRAELAPQGHIGIPSVSLLQHWEASISWFKGTFQEESAHFLKRITERCFDNSLKRLDQTDWPTCQTSQTKSSQLVIHPNYHQGVLLREDQRP